MIKRAMAFSLTVKQKIIGGFSAVGILLFGACMWFYTSLLSIESTYNLLNTEIIAKQQNASKLQTALLTLTKNTNTIYGTQNEKALQKLAQLHQDYKNVIITLLGKSKADFSADITTDAQKAIALADKLIANKTALLEARIEKAAQLQSHKAALSALSEALLNLEMLESNDQRLLEEIMGTAIRIDDMVFTLTNLTASIRLIEDIATLQKHQEDATFLIANVNDNLNFLRQQTQQLDMSEFATLFDPAFAKVKQNIEKPGVLYQFQSNELNKVSENERLFSEVELISEQLLSTLSQLFERASDEVAVSQQDASKQIASDQVMLLIIGVSFIALASVIAWVTVRAMVVPLNRINKRLGLVAEGDFSRPINKIKNDEFGELSDKINQVIGSLKTVFEEISNQVTELDSRLDNSDQRSANVAANAEQQISLASDTKQVAISVSDSAVNVKQQTEQSALDIKGAQQQGDKVLQLATQNQAQISLLAKELDNAVVMMSQLSLQTNNIGSILDTIVAIAEQTNLLALNAAIEAARAGEQGRGFAVVADEVRLLASRTQASTQEIASMITALQRDAGNTQNAIDAGEKMAIECAERSDALAKSIDEIEEGLIRLNTHGQAIFAASSAQSELANNIVHSMQTVEERAEQNSTEVARLSENISKISELSHSVSAALKRFKLH